MHQGLQADLTPAGSVHQGLASVCLVDLVARSKDRNRLRHVREHLDSNTGAGAKCSKSFNRMPVNDFGIESR